MNTRFYVDVDNNVYIESSSCTGLSFANANNDPGLVTTYGIGEQIKIAIEMGYKNIYVFMGGSARLLQEHILSDSTYI